MIMQPVSELWHAKILQAELLKEDVAEFVIKENKLGIELLHYVGERNRVESQSGFQWQ